MYPVQVHKYMFLYVFVYCYFYVSYFYENVLCNYSHFMYIIYFQLIFLYIGAYLTFP